MRDPRELEMDEIHHVAPSPESALPIGPLERESRRTADRGEAPRIEDFTMVDLEKAAQFLTAYETVVGEPGV